MFGIVLIAVVLALFTLIQLLRKWHDTTYFVKERLFSGMFQNQS